MWNLLSIYRWRWPYQQNTSLVTVKEEQGNAVFAVHLVKSPLISYILLTKWIASVLKMGVLCVCCEAYKDRLACSVSVRIQA